jgi:hypothetical protein
MDQNKSLRQHLVKMLDGGEAHATFDDAVKDMPRELQGIRPKGAEHSAWEELDHLRIAQWDIFEFATDPKHKSPKFPEGYWPKSPEPPNDAAWDKSVKQVHADVAKFQKVLLQESTDLFAKIPHGDGQTILRQALVAADHKAYHIGQLILVRRLLGAWK